MRGCQRLTCEKVVDGNDCKKCSECARSTIALPVEREVSPSYLLPTVPDIGCMS